MQMPGESSVCHANVTALLWKAALCPSLPTVHVCQIYKNKEQVGFSTQVHVLETSDMLCAKHVGHVHPFSETDFHISIVFLAFGHIGKCVYYLFLQFPVNFFIFLPPSFVLSYFWCILWQICLSWVTRT